MKCVPIEKIKTSVNGFFKKLSPREKSHIGLCRSCNQKFLEVAKDRPKKADLKNIPPSIRAESIARRINLTGEVASIDEVMFYESDKGWLGLTQEGFEFIKN